MKVLVTGSSGRIGSQVVAHLQAAGHTVHGFDMATPRTGFAPDKYFAGSLLDAESIKQAVKDIDAVVHLAAMMSWHPDDETALFDANVRGTFHLLQAAAGKIQRFVFASSGEVYPELKPEYLPIDEQHPTQPTSAYGMTKLLGEEMVKNFARRTGMQYCILRFSHTQAAEELFDANSFFGSAFYVNAKIRQLRKLPAAPAIEKTIAALEAIATPEEQHYIGCNPDGVPYRMGLCDTRDMMQGIRLGLEHPAAANDIFNIGAAESFNFDDAVSFLARYTGLPVHQVNLYTASYRYDTSIQKAQEKLGYAPQYTIFRMIEEIGQQKQMAQATIS